MSIRASDLPFEAVHAPAEALSLKRATLWALLASKVVTGWGVQWDIQWHVLIGRDSFWIPPHLITYAGVSAAVFLSFGMLFWETWRGTGDMRVLGLRGSRGFQLAAWGIAVTIIAAPIDDLWHRLFGIDVTLWSPPHLMGILGAVINAWACLTITREVYPAGSRARLAAMVLSGAVLYGSLHLVVDPSFRIAYLYGGVRFYTFAILAAVLLPLALVPTARLSGNRWTPVFVLVGVVLLGMAGLRIARVGFEIIQPVSVIEEEIAKDPTSPIAVATIMGRKNGVTPGRVGGWPLFMMGIAPVIAMALVDARRRPVAAAVTWSLLLFVVGGWLVSGRPAFASMAPGAGPTIAAFIITAAAAVVGGLAARRLADAL
ncbi:MAG TPA: hypothetical protein VGV06_17685 [Methylomirabilota bacterium]|nr:hypothetical protein [Methylomirabilota bacterium]